jgi:hypothetical protein
MKQILTLSAVSWTLPIIQQTLPSAKGSKARYIREQYQSGTNPKINSFFNNVSIMLSNLFYDMRSKFQNKVALPKKTGEVHSIISINIFPVAFL